VVSGDLFEEVAKLKARRRKPIIAYAGAPIKRENNSSLGSGQRTYQNLYRAPRVGLILVVLR
jgi:hypothetical protein